MNAVNMATALHRIAARNKLKRARRDQLLRDERFIELVEMLTQQSSDTFASRSIADLLWSFATLQYWPPTLLLPMLTSIDEQLKRDAFEAQHLSTVVWALAKLQCKPVRLLERIETQAISRLSGMTMQNFANLLWGFATLNYRPLNLIMPFCSELVASGLVATAKPVEVADTAYALAKIAAGEDILYKRKFEDILLTLAQRAAPEAALADFSSRQLVILISAFTHLEATAVLPAGRLDAWIAAARNAHMAKSLLAADATQLEEALGRIGKDASWIKNLEILNRWRGLADGHDSQSLRRYKDDELRAVFSAIDTDSSGAIDRQELLAAIKAIDLEVRLDRPYKGVMDCCSRVMQTEGIYPFWRGNLANVLRYFPTQALNFAFKDAIKVAFATPKDAGQARKFTMNILSGGMAGTCSLLFVYSLDYARTRLANDAKGKGGERQFNGLIDVHDEGSRSQHPERSGWCRCPGWVRQVPGHVHQLETGSLIPGRQLPTSILVL